MKYDLVYELIFGKPIDTIEEVSLFPRAKEPKFTVDDIHHIMNYCREKDAVKAAKELSMFLSSKLDYPVKVFITKDNKVLFDVKILYDEISGKLFPQIIISSYLYHKATSAQIAALIVYAIWFFENYAVREASRQARSIFNKAMAFLTSMATGATIATAGLTSGIIPLGLFIAYLLFYKVKKAMYKEDLIKQASIYLTKVGLGKAFIEVLGLVKRHHIQSDKDVDMIDSFFQSIVRGKPITKSRLCELVKLAIVDTPDLGFINRMKEVYPECFTDERLRKQTKL